METVDVCVRVRVWLTHWNARQIWSLSLSPVPNSKTLVQGLPWNADGYPRGHSFNPSMDKKGPHWTPLTQQSSWVLATQADFVFAFS
jgi:hypothetical protein